MSGVSFGVTRKLVKAKEVLLGYLKTDDRLPLIREAVEQLAINPNTVSKAYRQLEHEGIVSAKPGVGTFVAETPPGGTATSSCRPAR